MKNISLKTIERLILYKRLLLDLSLEGTTHIFSHEIAKYIQNEAPQVRRDLMLIGYSATSAKGYVIEDLIEKIRLVLNKPHIQNIALVGVGNLGRAILSYFSKRHPRLSIEAAFDSDETKVDRVIAGCRVHHINNLSEVIARDDISIGIITVPPQFAQETADALAEAGIKAILNFAPVPIHTPDEVILDELDITLKLEKLAFLIN